MSNRPLVYYWIAHYNDGTSTPQFDTKTYEENKFSDINNDKLIKFGLYPFSKEYADGIRKYNVNVISIPLLPTFEIDMSGDRRLIHYRDVFISQEEYHKCSKCNKEFNYGKTSPKTKSLVSSPICPHCSAYDVFKCVSCGHEMLHEERKQAKCSKCGGGVQLKKYTSQQYSREKRWIEYYLGYQETIKGVNMKYLMKIHENGNVEVI